MKKLSVLTLAVVLVAAVIVLAAGCGKKSGEEAKAPDQGATASVPPPQGGAPGGMPPGMGQEPVPLPGQPGFPQGEMTPENMPPGGMPPGGMPPGGMPPGGMPPGAGQDMPGVGRPMKSTKQVVVSDDIKKMWPAAKILVKKKDGSDEGKVYEVAAGKSINIPGTKLRIEVGQYVPDFFMDGQTVGSKSADPNNPTVPLSVFEGDQELYRGFAFEKFPETHAFSHADYSVILLGGVKKS